MVKQLMYLAGLAVAIVLVSCDSTTDPADPGVITPPGAPTELMATSIDSGTIRIRWTAADTGVAATGFIVVVEEDGSNNPQELPISDGSTRTINISNLTNATVYNFTVYALNDTARSGQSPTIRWAPANRYTTDIRLYETSSSMGSGLMLPNTAGLTIGQGGMWDLCLDTRGEIFDIGSPRLSSYTDEQMPPEFPNGDVARETLIGKTWTNVTSLDDIYESADLTQETLEEKLITFNDADAAGSAFAFVVKTSSGNYAKVMVTAVDGKILQGTADDRYIDLVVSYQSGADVPYAVISKGTSNKYSKKLGGVIETTVKKAF